MLLLNFLNILSSEFYCLITLFLLIFTVMERKLETNLTKRIRQT